MIINIRTPKFLIFIASVFSVFYISLSLTALNTKIFSQEGPPQSQNTTITISPAIIEKSLRPQEQSQEVIRIYNQTDIPLPTSIKIASYSIDENGITQISLENRNEQDSIVDWLSLDLNYCIIEPKSFKEITVSMFIPEGARRMSHFASILFQPVFPEGYFDPQSAKITPHVAAIIAIDVISENYFPPDNYIQIKSFETSPERESSILGVSAELTNDDLYYHRVKNTLHVFSITGKKVLVHELNGITLFPEMTRAYSQVIQERLPFGWYSAELITESNSTVTTASSSFFIPPTFVEWVLILISSMIIIIIIAFALRLFKRYRALKHHANS